MLKWNEKINSVAKFLKYRLVFFLVTDTFCELSEDFLFTVLEKLQLISVLTF